MVITAGGSNLEGNKENAFPSHAATKLHDVHSGAPPATPGGENVDPQYRLNVGERTTPVVGAKRPASLDRCPLSFIFGFFWRSSRVPFNAIESITEFRLVNAREYEREKELYDQSMRERVNRMHATPHRRVSESSGKGSEGVNFGGTSAIGAAVQHATTPASRVSLAPGVAGGSKRVSVEGILEEYLRHTSNTPPQVPLFNSPCCSIPTLRDLLH